MNSVSSSGRSKKPDIESQGQTNISRTFHREDDDDQIPPVGAANGNQELAE